MRKDAVGAGSESTVEWMALEGFARGSAETPSVSPRAGTRDPSWLAALAARATGTADAETIAGRGAERSAAGRRVSENKQLRLAREILAKTARRAIHA